MMLYRRIGLAGIVAIVLAACSSTGDVSGGDGTISIKEGSKPGVNAPTVKYAATIRLLPYVDERGMGNPRKIGVGGENIYGLNAPKGDDILLDRDVAAVVAGAMKKRLEDAGYQVVDEGNAHFEMGGTVKELTYNVKARDEVSITIATELKESGTGKVLWSGVVEEKKDVFAGVSGNDIGDVAAFLKKELGIVTKKTSDAISALLMAQHPELFSLIPGTKPIAGVTVLNAPNYASAVVPALPLANTTQGVLMVTTEPARAKIYIGGVYFGLSPLRLDMEPGIREVTARLDGYKKAAEKVSVRKGETTEVELKLSH
jgi:hypothetical protein